jgi:hypothetical protein
MKQILECLLAEMNAMQEKMDSNHERTEEKIGAEKKNIREKMSPNQGNVENCHQEMEAKTDGKQDKMATGQEEMKAQVGSLASWIDVNQEEMRARISAIQYKMEVMIKCSQQEMKAGINSIRAKLEETIKHPVEDILVCVDQRTWGFCKARNEKIDEMQVDLQAVETSFDTRTGSLKDDITDTKKDFHEAIANTKNDLHTFMKRSASCYRSCHRK